MSKILALDLAAKTGYYVGDNKPQTVDFPAATRSLDYWQWITDIIYEAGEARFDAVAIENPIGQRGHALESFLDFKSITKLACQLAEIPIYEYAPTTVKKVFVGYGFAKKDDIIKKCLDMGVEIPYRIMKGGPDKGKRRYDDNAADAVAVYHTHMEAMND